MTIGYAKVSPKFWTGTTGRELRGDTTAQVVAIYLMTSPHANGIGVFHCPPLYIAHETGCPIEGASKALLKLSEIGFCTVDAATDTIWVHEMAFFQLGAFLKPGDKRIPMAQRFFEAIPNPYMQRAFFEKNRDAYHLLPSPKMAQTSTPPEGASKVLRRGNEGASTNNNSNSNSCINNNNTITPSPSAPETDGGESSAKLPVKRDQTAPSSQSKATNADFNDWWLNYPLKKSKAAAQRIYERVVKDSKATVGELLTGAMRYSAERANQDPKYTKHPTTWLNGGCWADEGPPRLGGGFGGPSGGNSPPRSGAVAHLLNKIQSDKREVS